MVKMGFVALICPYCGGKLQSDGSEFLCPYCGNKVIFSPDRQNSDNNLHHGKIGTKGSPFSFSIDIQGTKRDFTDVFELTINTDYRRRTSMADKLPMTVVVLVDGTRSMVSDSFENVGRGSVRIQFDGKQFSMDNENKVKVFVNNRISSSLETFGDKDSVSIGSLSISFRK